MRTSACTSSRRGRHRVGDPWLSPRLARGRLAVVTGASRGIGAASAEAIAAAGAHVALAARDQDALEAVAQRVETRAARRRR